MDLSLNVFVVASLNSVSVFSIALVRVQHILLLHKKSLYGAVSFVLFIDAVREK